MMMSKRKNLAIAIAISLSASAVNARPGDSLHIVINIPAFRLFLFEGDSLLTSYSIAVGKPETQTPVGTFTVKRKVMNPSYWPKGQPPVPPGPGNPLGRYWIGLSQRDLGIHGTNEPHSIGTAASGGCIRMRESDLLALYDRVLLGTRVEIVYETRREGGGRQSAYADIYHHNLNNSKRNTTEPEPETLPLLAQGNSGKR